MGHYHGRDNRKRREKRRLKLARIRKERYCWECGCNLRDQQTCETINTRTREVTRRICENCDDREAYSTFEKKGTLSTRLSMTAELGKSYWEMSADERKRRRRIPALTEAECTLVCDAVGRIHAKVKEFERDVWFNGGLQECVLNERSASLAADGDGFEARVLSTGGRTIITLADVSDESLTVITAEDEKPYARREFGNDDMGPMGIQGMDCTEKMGVSLLERALANFPKLIAANVHLV